MGFVDGVDVAIEPIVRRLARAANHGPRENQSEHDEGPMTGRIDTTRDDAAQERPHGWKPRDGLQKFQHRRPSGTPLDH